MSFKKYLIEQESNVSDEIKYGAEALQHLLNAVTSLQMAGKMALRGGRTYPDWVQFASQVDDIINNDKTQTGVRHFVDNLKNIKGEEVADAVPADTEAAPEAAPEPAK